MRRLDCDEFGDPGRGIERSPYSRSARSSWPRRLGPLLGEAGRSREAPGAYPHQHQSPASPSFDEPGSPALRGVSPTVSTNQNVLLLVLSCKRPKRGNDLIVEPNAFQRGQKRP